MRFVVLATARSGSSLLVRDLETHPDCLMHGEIFHRDRTEHLQALAREAIEGSLETEPRSYARKVFSTNLGRRAVGFKMWYEQSPTACNYLLATRSVHKVILERENKLAQYSSAKLASITGVWNRHISDDRPWNGAVRMQSFDVHDFVNFVEVHRRVYEHYRERARGPIYEITYADVARSDFADLLKFLDLPLRKIDPRMKKLYGCDILDRYESHQHGTILETLGSLGKPHWVVEDLSSERFP